MLELSIWNSNTNLVTLSQHSASPTSSISFVGDMELWISMSDTRGKGQGAVHPQISPEGQFFA